jgi:hypothetical protein
VALEPGEPSAGEVAAARALEAGRYRSEAWNGRSPHPAAAR